MKNWCLLAFTFLLLGLGCEQRSTDNSSNKPFSPVEVKYAKGFDVVRYDDFSIITLKNPWKGKNTQTQYLLYKNEIPQGYDKTVKVKVPIKSIACLSLTHMAFIDKLGQIESIVAASGCNYSNNKKITDKCISNDVIEIGGVESLNYEVLLNESPDIVMCYGIDETSINYLNKLQKFGLNAVLNSEYMEIHPLGKAEWIKYVAEFYCLNDLADSIFSDIEREYLALTKLTDTIRKKPTVFVGMPWNGNWYIAGGKSFQAKLFNDAGADYLWKDNDDLTSVVRSKELIYDEAYDTDFWLNQNSYSSISAITDFDNRTSHFKSIKEGNLYNNNQRVNASQGNDYWESGTVNPHIVLKDLIEIFHPDLIDHQLYYYKKLK